MFAKIISLLLSLFLVQSIHASSITIKTINAHDLTHEQWDATHALWVDSFFNVYKDLPFHLIDNDIRGNTEEALIDWLQRLFAQYQAKALTNPYIFTYAYENEQLIGYTLHHLLPQASIIHIDHFVVSPHIQGKGVGKALLAAVIQNAPPIESIVLTTRILNESAQNFYKKQGFYQITSIENLLFDPSYSILLKKDILRS